MKNNLSGKTVLITGSTDGLGKLIAKHLCTDDANVLLHGRDEAKGNSVKEELELLSGNKKIKYFNADYASFREVKEFGEKILKDVKQIDILINNVGIGKGKINRRELSKDGIELRFQVNYLSHVLLTEMLLPVLPSNTANIINVASIGQEVIDFKNLMLEKNYDGFFAYRQSKTALIMYTFDLAERLKNRNIKVNAIHPATLMNTKMVLEEWDYTMTSVEQGAEAVENLLLTGSSGQYFDGKKPSKAIPQTYDPEARNALKNITLELLADFLK